MSWAQGNVYPISQLNTALEEALEKDNIDLRMSKGVEYYNIPCSFDIEVSSFKEQVGIQNDEPVYEKRAIMYVWQFGINGTVIIGRTWDEFKSLLSQLSEAMELNPKRRILVYVHNLGYEFQFMRNQLHFQNKNVFAIKNRRPVKATWEGIEFRCSYFLSNYSLQYLGDNLLHKYPVQKLVGALDYSKLRTPLSRLSDKEMAYCVNDVKVVMAFIQEKIEEEGNDITKIPLTNTGYVRRFSRDMCFYEENENVNVRKAIVMAYHAVMKDLTVTPQEYRQLNDAFWGGFTHAGAYHANQVRTDVGSADLASSYPYTMVSSYFPMGKGQYISQLKSFKEFQDLLETKCVVATYYFTNIRPRVGFENSLSCSRCKYIEKPVLNNGRVVKADQLSITMTELDFATTCRFYVWDEVQVDNVWVYPRGYLPKALIMACLQLYRKKTELKDVIGREIEYLVSKNMINAMFGMMVTAIVRDEFVYSDDGWDTLKANVEEQIDDYNNNWQRFLFYAWGVYTTAHARYNLFSAIYEFGPDFVYADTDSIKGINFHKHQRYFIDYNNRVFEKLMKVSIHYNIPFRYFMPKTPKGKQKLIGVWEMEAPYALFKTCGAKRYMYETYDGMLNITVAGLNKKYAVPYLLSTFASGYIYNDAAMKWLAENQQPNWRVEACEDAFLAVARLAYSNNGNGGANGVSEALEFISQLNLDHELCFRMFTDGMFIPANHTGKMSLTYIDKPIEGDVEDYQGNVYHYREESCIHMEPGSFHMSMTEGYRNFLDGIEVVEY